MSEPKPTLDQPSTPSVGHELSDAKIRPVLTFGIGLAIVLLAVLLAMAGLFQHLAGREARLDVPAPPVTVTPPAPGPSLQAAPAQDLKAMREVEDGVLNSYGWTDRDAGIVRIPIDRAMALLAERGLPVRPERQRRR